MRCTAPAIATSRQPPAKTRFAQSFLDCSPLFAILTLRVEPENGKKPLENP